MDLNFTFSPSPSKRPRAGPGPLDSPLADGSAEKTRSAARDLLSGALAEAIKKEDEEAGQDCWELDSLSASPVKRMPGLSPFASPAKQIRRRKRKSEDKSDAFHHTFVMKLFDRSVDLAQFRAEAAAGLVPLYPVCRAWMRNEPGNTRQAPRGRSPTPEPEEGSDGGEEGEGGVVFRLPRPAPPPTTNASPRLPPPMQGSSAASQELDTLDLEQADSGPPPAVLLSNHLDRWLAVRKAWKQAAHQNEERYQKSLTILKEMFEK